MAIVNHKMHAFLCTMTVTLHSMRNVTMTLIGQLVLIVHMGKRKALQLRRHEVLSNVKMKNKIKISTKQSLKGIITFRLILGLMIIETQYKTSISHDDSPFIQVWLVTYLTVSCKQYRQLINNNLLQRCWKYEMQYAPRSLISCSEYFDIPGCRHIARHVYIDRLWDMSISLQYSCAPELLIPIILLFIFSLDWI